MAVCEDSRYTGLWCSGRAWRSPKPLTGVRILPGLQECVTLHDFKTIFRFLVRENMEVKFRAGSSGESGWF